MKSITIVPAQTPALIDIVAALARVTWREHYPAIIGSRQVEYMLERFQSPAAIAEQIREGYRYYIIRDGGNDPAGYFAVFARENELFLGKLYVVAEKRGRGYGKHAIAFIDNIARAAGIARITLTVNKNNHASIKAYQRFGFVIVRSLVQDIGNGFVMDDYVMEKSVSAKEKKEKLAG